MVFAGLSGSEDSLSVWEGTWSLGFFLQEKYKKLGGRFGERTCVSARCVSTVLSPKILPIKEKKKKTN